MTESQSRALTPEEIVKKYTGALIKDMNASNLLEDMRSLVAEAQRKEREKDGPLLSCPWCRESLVGKIHYAQISHLIGCGDKQVAEARREQIERDREVVQRYCGEWPSYVSLRDAIAAALRARETT